MAFSFGRDSVVKAIAIPNTPPPQPDMQVSALSATFTTVAGTSSPATQIVQITNRGTGTMGVPTLVTTSSGWLSGVLSGSGNSWTLTITSTLGVLAAGIYQGTIRVASAGCLNSPQTITVTFTVVASSGTSATFMGVNLPNGDNQVVYDFATKTLINRTVDKPSVASYTGTVRTLPATGNAATNTSNFATAWAASAAGDIIELPAEDFNAITITTGKSGYILVRTGNGSLYNSGVRRKTTTGCARILSTAGGNGGPAINFQAGAKFVHFQDVWVQTRQTAGTFYQGSLVETSNSSLIHGLSDVPSRIGFERVYFDNGSMQPQGVYTRRGLGIYMQYVFVDDCHFNKFCDPNTDSQAILLGSGGPLNILNTYLDGMHENFMVGGVAPCAGTTNGHDIFIKRCHFFTDPSQTGQVSIWGAKKNNCEIKNAVRIAVADCKLQHSWAQGQSGQTFAYKANETNTGQGVDNYCLDVVTMNCHTSETGAGIGIATQNSANPTLLRFGRILFHNLLFTNVRYTVPGFGIAGEGRHAITKIPGNTTGSCDFVTFNKITAVPATEALGNSSPGLLQLSGGTLDGGQKFPQFTYTNCVIYFGNYGINANNGGDGSGALDSMFVTWMFKSNVIWGANVRSVGYPANNFYIKALNTVLPNWSAGDYTVAPAYANVGVDPTTGNSDGSPVGFDPASLTNHLYGCITGAW